MNRINLRNNSWVIYCENYITETDISFKDEIVWEEKYAKIRGKYVKLPRLVAFMSEEVQSFKFTGVLMKPQPIPTYIKVIMEDLGEKLGCKFNAVFMNYYKNGDNYIGWHKDNDKSTIASLSFNEGDSSRDFKIKCNNTKEVTTFKMSDGDLIVMGGNFQKNYIHQLPKRRMDKWRINVTFRCL